MDIDRLGGPLPRRVTPEDILSSREGLVRYGSAVTKLRGTQYGYIRIAGGAECRAVESLSNVIYEPTTSHLTTHPNSVLHRLMRPPGRPPRLAAAARL